MQNYKGNRKHTVVTESVLLMLSINVKLLELQFRYQNMFFVNIMTHFIRNKTVKMYVLLSSPLLFLVWFVLLDIQFSVQCFFFQIMFVLFHLAIIIIFYLRLLITPLLPLLYLQTFILYAVSSFYPKKIYISNTTLSTTQV